MVRCGNVNISAGEGPESVATARKGRTHRISNPQPQSQCLAGSETYYPVPMIVESQRGLRRPVAHVVRETTPNSWTPPSRTRSAMMRYREIQRSLMVSHNKNLCMTGNRLRHGRGRTKSRHERTLCEWGCDANQSVNVRMTSSSPR
jgi:hypothetical protein